MSTIELANNNAGTSSSLRTAFNDNGDLALRITFSDGSEGIFTTGAAMSRQLPSVTAAPVSQQAILGSTVNLSVGFSGTGPVRPQWRHGGVLIPGSISTLLTFVMQQ